MRMCGGVAVSDVCVWGGWVCSCVCVPVCGVCVLVSGVWVW